MLTSSIQSAPCPTADAASDMVGGMLLSFGKDQEVKVIRMETHEVEGGLWVATAFFEISQPETDVDEDEEEKGPGKERTESDKFKMNDDPDVALWHGLTRQQEPEIPAGQDIPELKDIEYTQPALPILADDTHADHHPAEDSVTGLSDEEKKLSENLQSEFQKVEEAANVIEADLSHLPVMAAGTGYVDDRTYEERRKKAELDADEEELERLKRMQDDLMALQDAPTVDPAPPQG